MKENQLTVIYLTISSTGATKGDVKTITKKTHDGNTEWGGGGREDITGSYYYSKTICFMQTFKNRHFLTTLATDIIFLSSLCVFT